MFLNCRRSVSLYVFIILFGFMWILLFVFLSTWDSKFLKLLNQEISKSSKFGNKKFKSQLWNLSSEFFKAKITKAQKYRKMFNLKNPGDMGKPVNLPEKLPDDVKKLVDAGWKDYTINEFVSELIPLRRKLPDIRNDYCLAQTYKNLPKASVIIIFHNEAWTMILRTMHSVLDRSPDELLEEIIFVDDCSDRGSKQDA